MGNMSYLLYCESLFLFWHGLSMYGNIFLSKSITGVIEELILLHYTSYIWGSDIKQLLDEFLVIGVMI